MTKCIEISDGGYVWHIPLQRIAENRAENYAKKGTDEFDEEVAFVMGDSFEGLDWFLNNMDFEDVADCAKLLETPSVKSQPNMSVADCEIIEVSA